MLKVDWKISSAVCSSCHSLLLMAHSLCTTSLCRWLWGNSWAYILESARIGLLKRNFYRWGCALIWCVTGWEMRAERGRARVFPILTALLIESAGWPRFSRLNWVVVMAHNAAPDKRTDGGSGNSRMAKDCKHAKHRSYDEWVVSHANIIFLDWRYL